jgi:hypothetical protein
MTQLTVTTCAEVWEETALVSDRKEGQRREDKKDGRQEEA